MNVNQLRIVLYHLVSKSQDPGLNFNFWGNTINFILEKISPIKWICEVNQERGGGGSLFISVYLEEKTSRRGLNFDTIR